MESPYWYLYLRRSLNPKICCDICILYRTVSARSLNSNISIWVWYKFEITNSQNVRFKNFWISKWMLLNRCILFSFDQIFGIWPQLVLAEWVPVHLNHNIHCFQRITFRTIQVQKRIFNGYFLYKIKWRNYSSMNFSISFSEQVYPMKETHETR